MLRNTFASRHIGISENDLALMLKETGASTLDQLIDETVPSSIRLKNKLALPESRGVYEILKELQNTAYS